MTNQESLDHQSARESKLILKTNPRLKLYSIGFFLVISTDYEHSRKRNRMKSVPFFLCAMTFNSRFYLIIASNQQIWNPNSAEANFTTVWLDRLGKDIALVFTFRPVPNLLGWPYFFKKWRIKCCKKFKLLSWLVFSYPIMQTFLQFEHVWWINASCFGLPLR